MRTYSDSLRFLDLSCCTITGNHITAYLQQLRNLEYIRCVSLGSAEACVFENQSIRGIEILDSRGLALKSRTHVSKVEQLCLWQARGVKSIAVKNIVSAKMQVLCITNAPYVDVAVLKRITYLAPPLRVLVLRDVGAFDNISMDSCLSTIANSLEALDLSDSSFLSKLPQNCVFPKLRSLVLDNTGVSSMNILLFTPMLEVLSLARCRHINNDSFRQVIELNNLKVARLSGTKIGDATLSKIQASTKLVYLNIESCREINRETRLKIGKKYASCPSLASLLPENLFLQISFSNS